MSGLLAMTRDLAAGYGRALAIEDVTFEVDAGQRVALLGPNGGGKTTLLRVLLGELRPMRGTVEVQGRAATVPQTERSRLDFPVSAFEVALMGALPRLPWWRRPGHLDREVAHAALERVGVADRANDTFGDLSGGQRQRVLIARALVQDARVLLLDEPLSGVDAPSAARIESVLRELRDEGRALLVATHDVEQASRFERVLCLHRRQVAFGAPAEVLGGSVLQETYGDELVVLEGGRPAVNVGHHDHHH
jgi:ABC-type Mn2+/Zn2+ transport system ATPase subunit